MATGEASVAAQRDGAQTARGGVTRGDIAMVLGLAGLILGGCAFFFGFKTSRGVDDLRGVMQNDGLLYEQLVEEKTQLQRDLAEANKRISGASERMTEFEDRQLRDAIRLAAGLAAQGRREGIDVLVDIILRKDERSQETSDVKWRAGLKLNELLPRAFFREVSDEDSKKAGMLRTKALVDAASDLRMWWAAAKDRVKFDEATGKWTE